MAEGRDRLQRPLEVVSRLYGSGGHVVLLDEPGSRNSVEDLAINASNSVTPITGRGRHSPESVVTRRQSTTRRGLRSRGRSGLLPSWYPRRPLADITTLVGAMERRRIHPREEQVEVEDEESSFQTPIHNRRGRRTSLRPFVTPCSNLPLKIMSPAFGKVPIIVSSVAKPAKGGESAFITPQKLLKSIETVGREALDELERLKRTPIVKMENREKRVRALKALR